MRWFLAGLLVIITTVGGYRAGSEEWDIDTPRVACYNRDGFYYPTRYCNGKCSQDRGEISVCKGRDCHCQNLGLGIISRKIYFMM